MKCQRPFHLTSAVAWPGTLTGRASSNSPLRWSSEANMVLVCEQSE